MSLGEGSNGRGNWWEPPFRNHTPGFYCSPRIASNLLVPALLMISTSPFTCAIDLVPLRYPSIGDHPHPAKTDLRIRLVANTGRSYSSFPVMPIRSKVSVAV